MFQCLLHPPPPPPPPKKHPHTFSTQARVEQLARENSQLLTALQASTAAAAAVTTDADAAADADATLAAAVATAVAVAAEEEPADGGSAPPVHDAADGSLDIGLDLPLPPAAAEYGDAGADGDEAELEPELEPEYEDYAGVQKSTAGAAAAGMGLNDAGGLRAGLHPHHSYLLSRKLCDLSERATMRQAMERWAAFVSNRQRATEVFEAHGRGTVVVMSAAARILLWRRYHRWRLWLGLRRRNPKEFGLIPRALVYDPAEPEIGDIDTIKDRIEYHNQEIVELSGVVQRHHEILELLRGTLQRKLAEEMAGLHKLSEQLECDRAKFLPGGSEPPQPPPPPPAPPQQQQPPPTGGYAAISPPPPSHPGGGSPQANVFSGQVGGRAPQGPPSLPALPVTHNRDVGGELVAALGGGHREAAPFSVPVQGYISKGGDLRGGPKWLTLEEAQATARGIPECLGFTYNVQHTTADGRVLAYFKTKCDVHQHATGWRSFSRFNVGVDSAAAAVASVGRGRSVGTDAAGAAAALAVAAAAPDGGAEVVGLAHHYKDPCEVLAKYGISAHQRRRLIDFYQVHNPSKLPSVMHTLVEFRGHEEALFAALQEQYGSEPHDVPRSLPLGCVPAPSSLPFSAFCLFFLVFFSNPVLTTAAARKNKKNPPFQREHNTDGT